MKLSREFKAGVVVVFGIAILVVGVFFLKGVNLFGENRNYYALYDNVDGLGEATPVMVKGYKVGQVTEIRLIPERGNMILVTMLIDNPDLQIPKDAKARIYSADLFTKAIEIRDGTSEVMAQPGDTLLSDIQASIQEEVNKQVLPLKEKAEDLISSIDSIMAVVQAVLDKNVQANLTQSFESIRRSINALERTSLRIDTMIASEKVKVSNIMSNIQSITSNISKNNDELTATIKNMKIITDSIAKSDLTSTINNVNKTMGQVADITTKINNGEGTMGMLINNDSLYNALVNTNAELRNLLEDMRVNPNRYLHFSVFGRKDKNTVKLTPQELRNLKKLLNK